MSGEGGIHVVRQGAAQPITDARPIVLLYGPDAELKAAAAVLRDMYRDKAFQTRSTDQISFLHSFTPETGITGVVLMHSELSPYWAEAFERCKLEFKHMAFVDGKFVSVGDVEKKEQEALASGKEVSMKLRDGRLVGRTAALAKAANTLGISGDQLTALDEATIEEAINSAYNVPADEKPPAKPAGGTGKRKK